MFNEASTYPIKVPQNFYPYEFFTNFPSFHSRENLRRVFDAMNVLRKTKFEREEKREKSPE